MVKHTSDKLKSKIQHPVTWSVTVCLPHCLCYGPGVFFCTLVSLYLMCVSKNVVFSFHFLKTLSLKSRESQNACICTKKYNILNKVQREFGSFKYKIGYKVEASAHTDEDTHVLAWLTLPSQDYSLVYKSKSFKGLLYICMT
jgi:hypothetical protein